MPASWWRPRSNSSHGGYAGGFKGAKIAMDQEGVCAKPFAYTGHHAIGGINDDDFRPLQRTDCPRRGATRPYARRLDWHRRDAGALRDAVISRLPTIAPRRLRAAAAKASAVLAKGATWASILPVFGGRADRSILICRGGISSRDATPGVAPGTMVSWPAPAPAW